MSVLSRVGHIGHAAITGAKASNLDQGDPITESQIMSVVPYSPYFVDGQPHPDWLGGGGIAISGTGGDISFRGSGDVEVHESTNEG